MVCYEIKLLKRIVRFKMLELVVQTKNKIFHTILSININSFTPYVLKNIIFTGPLTLVLISQIIYLM